MIIQVIYLRKQNESGNRGIIRVKASWGSRKTNKTEGEKDNVELDIIDKD